MWSVAILLIASIVYVSLPHRTQTIQAHSTLQNGMKMEAHFTVQSPWGWAVPDRLITMDVSINGKDVPIAREAYYGLRPFDLKRRPIIAETKGFPEIVMWGVPKGSLGEVHWHFLNYSFSELNVMKDRHENISYFSTPPPPLGQMQLAQYNAPVPVTIIGKESIKKISSKDLTK